MPTFITDKVILDTFWRDDREGQFDVAFDVRGRVRETIRAGTLAEARALADEMAQGEEMELYGPDLDDVRIDYIRPCPPMYLVLRDGKEWGVSHVQVVPASSMMWRDAWLPLHDPTEQVYYGGGSCFPFLAAEYERFTRYSGVLLNNCAVGASRSFDWDAGDANWTSMEAKHKAALDAAHAANLPIGKMAVLCDLGEGDALANTAPATFKTTMQGHFTRLRAIVGAQVPIFYRPPGRGNPTVTGEAVKFAGIRQAIQEIVNEDANIFMLFAGEASIRDRGLSSATSSGANTDYYHESLEAQKEFGEYSARIIHPLSSAAVPPNYTRDIARPA